MSKCADVNMGGKRVVLLQNFTNQLYCHFHNKKSQTRWYWWVFMGIFN